MAGSACNFRVGTGYDIHRLVEGRPLWIGGVRIPYEKGLKGHSDADVLIHAICDALLGGAALRDIGFHFPDTDPKYAGIDSKKLLRLVVELLESRGYSVVNIDSVIIAEAPKMNPYIPQMVQVIADILGVDKDVVSVKASTNERIGTVGRGEGIVAMASVLLLKSTEPSDPHL